MKKVKKHVPKECMFVRFQVPTVAGMKMTAVWNLTLCSLIEVDWCFRGMCYYHHQGNDHLADGSSMHL
jgi:hypothetical protein